MILGAILLLGANPLFGYEQSDETPFSIGIGIPFGKRAIFLDDDEFIQLPTTLSNVYLPIVIQSMLRIEPEFGLWRYSYNMKNSIEYTENFTSFRLGCGFFVMMSKEKVSFSGGLRSGFMFTSSKCDYDPDLGGYDDEEASKTDFFIGPAIGAEYFFSRHFSLGGEAQLNYIRIGEWKYDGEDDDDIDRSESIITNNHLIFLRWYY
jgi:hypothetical protein